MYVWLAAVKSVRSRSVATNCWSLAPCLGGDRYTDFIPRTWPRERWICDEGRHLGILGATALFRSWAYQVLLAWCLIMLSNVHLQAETRLARIFPGLFEVRCANCQAHIEFLRRCRFPLSLFLEIGVSHLYLSPAYLSIKCPQTGPLRGAIVLGFFLKRRLAVPLVANWA